jgi:hypothetical protein
MAEDRPASGAIGERTVEPVVHRGVMNTVAMQSESSPCDAATGQEAIPATSGAGVCGESGSSLISRYMIAILAALVGIVLLSRRRIF